MSTHIKKKRLYEIPFLRILIMSTKGGKKKKKNQWTRISLPSFERERREAWKWEKICSLTLVLLKKNFNIYTSIIMLVYDLIIKI